MNLIERDKEFIWHPFTPQKNMPQPIAVIKAANSLLFDENNNAYIDAISSWWVTIHGHAHPYIAEKLYRQALQLEHTIFAGFTHLPAVELAEKLLGVLPKNFSKVFYSDDGSTATEVALKMAVQFWWNNGETKRNKIFAFNNSYHGDTVGAMSVSDRSVFTLAFRNILFDVIFIDTPTKENVHQIENIINQHAAEAAAFIYEPLVQGAGGMKMYDASLLDSLLALMQKHNIICIADEVMTGFGRTGKFFASEYTNVMPDIICMSKGITGGTMALGATACTNKIYEAFVADDKTKTFFHGHSFTANPLACTVAIASLELFEKENTLEKIKWIEQENKKFAESVSKKGNIKNVRTLGTIAAFEIVKGEDNYLNDISTDVTKKALSLGVYLRPLGNTVYIMPPYCITYNELQKIYEVINKIIE